MSETNEPGWWRDSSHIRKCQLAKDFNFKKVCERGRRKEAIQDLLTLSAFWVIAASLGILVAMAAVCYVTK